MGSICYGVSKSEFFSNNYPVGVVEIVVHYFQFAHEMLLDESLEFLFAKHVIKAMVDGSLFVFVFYACIYEARVLCLATNFFPLTASCFCLEVVLQVPGHEDVLRRELFVLLLVSPHEHEHSTTNAQHAAHLVQRFHPQSLSRKVMNDGN